MYDYVSWLLIIGIVLILVCMGIVIYKMFRQYKPKNKEGGSLINDKEFMKKVYERYPRQPVYIRAPGTHICLRSVVIYHGLNNIDIVRCNVCGHEWEILRTE